MLDLFGNHTKPVTYASGAYPAMPGSGPDGATCRTCQHKQRLLGAKRAYLKCALVKHTHGAGTDIKASTPACRCYQPRTEP